MTIGTEDKKKNLSEVLSKRCHGLIKRDVIDSVVERLDCNKQMKIDLVSKSFMEQIAKKKTIVNLVDGKITGINVQWARCLLGGIKFGEEVVFIEDGEEIIKKSINASIKTNPTIIQLDEQCLGDLDSLFTKILLVL